MSNKIFTRDKILKEAAQYANEVGLDRISIRSLSRRLGSSVMPIYESFNNKKLLIEALLELILKENHSNIKYFERNNEILKYGLYYPSLYRDVQIKSQTLSNKNYYYEKIIRMMSEDLSLSSFNHDELKSIHFDLMVYINGLISRSEFENYSYEEFKKILEQATKLILLGYEKAKEIYY